MRSSYLGLAFALALSSGGLVACGQCDATCFSTVSLAVRDPSGAQVTSFSGVVSIEGDSLAVACPASMTTGYSCRRYATLEVLALGYRGSPSGVEAELTTTSTPVLAFSVKARVT